MSEAWEQYLNKPAPKTVLTREILREELGEDRKGVFLAALICAAPGLFLIVFILIFSIWVDIPTFLFESVFLNFRSAVRTVLAFVGAIGYIAISVKLVKYGIKLYKAQKNGIKIVSAMVSGMREDRCEGALGGSCQLWYLTFPCHGEICLQSFDYTYTDHPMADMDVYFSTSIGDEFYLMILKKDGHVAKVFPAKYFELSDEVKAWLK